MSGIIVGVACAICCVSVSNAGTEPADVSVELTADVTSVLPWEPLTITVKVANNTTGALLIPADPLFGNLELQSAWAGPDKAALHGRTWGTASNFCPVLTPLRAGDCLIYKVDISELAPSPAGHVPGRYVITAILESDGEVQCFDPVADEVVATKCWAGKVQSKALTIEVRQPVSKADVEALKFITAKGFCPWAALLSQYPDSTYAKHAMYQIAFDLESWNIRTAESIERTKRLYERIAALREPFHFSDDALLQLAIMSIDSRREDGFSKPIAMLKELLVKYPKSDSVSAALVWLNKLRKWQEERKPTEPKDQSNEATDTETRYGTLFGDGSCYHGLTEIRPWHRTTATTYPQTFFVGGTADQS